MVIERLKNMIGDGVVDRWICDLTGEIDLRLNELTGTLG